MGLEVTSLIEKLRKRDRLALAQAITLLESERTDDQVLADSLMEQIHSQRPQGTLRVGITGSPGAGKSSLIEKLGLEFISGGHRVAVLAIDPSSEITKGSILGDKTRMEQLSVREEAFIRPSASRGHLGGVSTATHDAISVCEMAGYDVVIVETVGVGQSEAQVSDLVDIFVMVTIPNAGDELQGIKRGILEKVDLLVVNKFDGENKISAQLAEKQLKSSLRILRQQDVPVLLTSAADGAGVAALGKALEGFWQSRPADLVERRQKQEIQWISHYLEQFLRLELQARREASADVAQLEKAVKSQQLLPRTAARTLLKKLITFV